MLPVWLYSSGDDKKRQIKKMLHPVKRHGHDAEGYNILKRMRTLRFFAWGIDFKRRIYERYSV